ncbi:tape measure protein [Candidatus Enterococcus ikei]|uniref:Tape measure protein n=1 Tax=Candidatus Enterococcus ikei TaxID=2815326 RepID=A0ABS3GUN3_9ENTE|nr:tape measure protein [Enterococcus sp. DIV0869a]MBO0438972.1 tape measure protein [Enterococcus sp. DIV0869a]
MSQSYSIQAVLSAVDKDFTSKMNDAVGTTDKLDDGMKKTNTSILDIAKGVGVFKLVDIGVSAITNSLGGAIKRFDTLNQYPTVLQSLGASAEEADSGMQILSDGIDGLPSTLDEVTGTAQQMFLVFRDADKASESTIALNNALLASGSSGDKAARGTEQYLKMLRSGKVDMEIWGTLQDTMGIGLDKTATSMLGAGASTQDLYKALQSGEISVTQFNDEIIKLNDGVGGFAELARANSKGIGTSFKNMGNAVTKGVANVIKALDQFVKDAGINADGIMGIFDKMKEGINTSFKIVIGSIEAVTPYFGQLFKVIGSLTPLLPPLAIGLTGVGTAIGTMKVINTITPMITRMSDSVKIATNVFQTYTVATKAGMASMKAYQAATAGGSIAIKTTTVLLGALTGKISLSTGAQMLATKATIGFKAAASGLYAALGPLGIAMGAIAAVSATVIWMTNKNTKASKELKKAQDDMKDSLEESTISYDKGIEKTRAQSDVNRQLKDEVVDLATQENKSAETKELLKTKVDELNSKVQGLGLAYNEEADGITMSNEQLEKRLELQEKQEMGNAAEERLIELHQKRAEATENLKNAEEAKQEVDNKFITWGNEIKNTEEALTTAKENRNNIEEQIAQATITRDNGLKASAEELTLVQNQMVEQQKVNYADLTESQKTAFDAMQTQYDSLREKTTSAFDAIEQKQTISLEQMVENLNKNAEAVRMWSENVATLAERGVDQGLITQLEKMGPAGAQQAAELVNRSDEELRVLSDTYSNSVKAANEAMVRTAGEGSQPFVDEMSKTVDKAAVSSKNAFESSDLFTLGGRITGTIKDDIDKNSNQVEEASKGLVNKAVDPLKDLQPKLYQSGKEAPNGLAKGINENTEVAGKASEKMGDTVDEQLRSSLGIHSPSRVMVENGNYITAGLAQGIKNGENEPIQNIQSITEKLKDEFNGLPNEMNTIGNYVMQGFADGINQGGESAIANANRIANDVANTMRKALDVHSPSRVMMKIGGFVGEGLAIGMEKSAKMVDKASNILSNSAMNVNNNSLGQSGQLQFSNSQALYVTVESMLNGKVIAEETAPFMAAELQGISNKRNTSLGRRY